MDENTDYLELQNSPDISNLISSLRDIGYSLETAVADIIDNSITAGAKNVFIYSNTKEQNMAIFDDGCGMSGTELKQAMKLGSTPFEKERSKFDLGRFGIGLKTASFSQCRKLSVISQKDKITSGFCWDLDYLKEKNDWLMKLVTQEIFSDLELSELLHTDNDFSVVIWENIDRFETENDFIDACSDLEEHLSLVFHRYLEGEFIGRKLNIFFNNRKIEPFNPFFPNHQATQEKTSEKIFFNSEKIEVTPYILPHHSKVTDSDYRKYATRDGYQKAQGFYLYREGRLLVHGTWFRLHKQCEAHKLVRIKIDINNKIDAVWNIDVKKSTASPPATIRKELARIINDITKKGFRVYSSKGMLEKKTNIVQFWNVKHQNDKIKFIINRDHPIYELLKHEIDEQAFQLFEKYISGIENYIPIEDIYSRLMQNEKNVSQKDALKEEDLRAIILSFFKSNFGINETLNMLKASEIYEENKHIIESILQEYSNERV